MPPITALNCSLTEWIDRMSDAYQPLILWPPENPPEVSESSPTLTLLSSTFIIGSEPTGRVPNLTAGLICCSPPARPDGSQSGEVSISVLLLSFLQLLHLWTQRDKHPINQAAAAFAKPCQAGCWADGVLTSLALCFSCCSPGSSVWERLCGHRQN